MPSTAPIKVPIRGIDKYSKAFNKMNAKVARMGRNVKAAGRTMTTSLTLPIVMFGASAMRSGIQFDDVMRKVQAKSGATAKDMSAIRVEAKKLGAETRFTAVQAGEGFDKLAMAGWGAEDMLVAMRPTLNLAAAASADVAMTADVMSDTMGAFHIKASESTRVVDVMATTLTSANVDMETYKDSMKYTAPVAKEFGMSIEDASAAVGFLGNVGIKGSQSGTALRKVMLSLATATGPAAKELKKYGVEVEDDNGKLRRFIDIMGDMSGAFVTQGTSQKEILTSMKEIFGIRSITGAAALSASLKEGGGSLVKLTTALNSIQPGKAQAMADVMEGGAGGDWRRMAAAFEAMQIAFAESGLLDDLASVMKDLAKWMREISQKDPDALKNIAKGLGAIAVLGPALMITGNALIVFAGLRSVFGPASMAVKGLAVKLGLLKVAGNGAATSLGSARTGALKFGSATARMGPMIGIATAAAIALKIAMDEIADASARLDATETLRKKASTVMEEGTGASKTLKEKRAALKKIRKLRKKAGVELTEGKTLVDMFSGGEGTRSRAGTYGHLLKMEKRLMGDVNKKVEKELARFHYQTDTSDETKTEWNKQTSESKVTIDFTGLPDGAVPKVTKQKGGKVEVKDNGAVMQGAL